ncbi:MAG: YitT family protein, partial [Ignavibacteriaceae bacterium]|nr:YitT family protein [Ignavibacteriaceae bacterium]
MIKKLSKHPLLDYFFMAVGAAIMAIGIGVFLVDAQVVPGGVTGLSMAIHYMSNYTIPVGLMIWVLNVPLYLWGVKELGKTFGIRTFYAFTLNSIFIDLFRGDIPGFTFLKLQKSQTVLDLYKNDFFFLILIGAVLLGLGLGIVFKFRGTTGGSDIVASIMQKRYGIRPGQAIFIIDIFVILIAGFIIEIKHLSPVRPALSLTFYAVFLLFVSSKIVDVIIEGFDYARAAYIISDKQDEIAEVVLTQFGRGATSLHATGLYT